MRRPRLTFDHMLRVVGIVALFVLAACDQTNAKVGPSPSPVIAQGSWTQNLVLTGEMPGRITTIVADQGTQQTFCSGPKARNGETWASTFYTTVDASSNEWQLSINVANFRGPGTYTNRDVQVSLQAPGNSRAWLNQDVDATAKRAAAK